MDSSHTDPYLSIVDLYRRLDALVPANRSNPITSSDHECLELLTSARLTRDDYLAQCESSRQDVVAARERLKLHEARANHLTATANAIEDFIGEARSRFRARGIPIHPISIPPRISSPTPFDLASQLLVSKRTAATSLDCTQESAGGMFTVTGATSNRGRK